MDGLIFYLMAKACNPNTEICLKWKGWVLQIGDMRRGIRIIGIVWVMLVAVGGRLFAQQVISGRVTDKETGAALPGTTLLQLGQERGVVADSNGQFTLEIQPGKPQVRVQFLGYKTVIERVMPDKSVYNFALEVEEISLPGALITDSKIQRVYPDKRVMVVDYEFLGDNIIVIIYARDRGRNVLQLLSPDLAILSEYDDPEDPPQALVQDCIGARHCISARFAGQVDYFAGNQLIVRKDSLHLYRKYVEPCLASLDSTYFFGFAPNDYSRSFTWVRADGKRRGFLYGSIDKEALTRVKDEEMMAQMTGGNASVEITSSYSGRVESREAFQAGLNASYLKTIAFPPSFVPILTVASTACVFDHPHHKILRFNAQGKQLSAVPITYDKLKHWKKFILASDDGSEVFTITEQNGYTTLHRIDLSTGALAEQWELPFQFVQKISVKGRYAYFTYRDSQYDPVKRLFRMEM